MRDKWQGFDFLATLMLICLFSGFMLMILLQAIGIYKDISSVMDEQYTERTGISYIVAKIRHYDEIDGVEMGYLEEQEALVLKETIDGKEYCTYLYEYDGYLRELFCEAGSELEPASGEKITMSESLDFAVEKNGVIRVSFCGKAGEENLCISLRSQCGSASDRGDLIEQ